MDNGMMLNRLAEATNIRLIEIFISGISVCGHGSTPTIERFFTYIGDLLYISYSANNNIVFKGV